jgi:hypothetical protein
MAQHDYVIGNDTAANVRADINTALAAIVSNNSGASAPATMYANQFWYDTTTDILKFRAEANDAWISVGKLDQTLDQFFPIVAGVQVVATGTELNFVDGVTSAIQTQIDAKAPLASPALTGTPTAPTATAATSTTQLATTAFVTTADNLKANLASPALTGTPTAPTAAVATNTTQIATTAFVLANGVAPTTAQVGTATAGLAAGAVGSYMFARSSPATSAAFGTTFAGSDLLPTSAIYSTTGSCSNVSMSSGSTQSGTWRAMGEYDYSTPNGTSGSSFGATLWLRIS